MCDFNKMKSNYMFTHGDAAELHNFYKWGSGAGWVHFSAHRKRWIKTKEQNPNDLLSSKLDSSALDDDSLVTFVQDWPSWENWVCHKDLFNFVLETEENTNSGWFNKKIDPGHVFLGLAQTPNTEGNS